MGRRRLRPGASRPPGDQPGAGTTDPARAAAQGLAAIFLTPFGLAGARAAIFEPLLLAGALAVAVLSTALPFALEFAALQRLSPRTYGVLVTLEPAVAVLTGAVLLAQPAGTRTLLAVSCVMAAAIGVTWSDRRGPGL